MKLIGAIGAAVLALGITGGARAQTPQNNIEAASYVVRAGDVVVLEIWGDKTLSGELTVQPDGKIELYREGPQIDAAGLRLGEVRKKVEAWLSTLYVKLPAMVVAVKAPK